MKLYVFVILTLKAVITAKLAAHFVLSLLIEHFIQYFTVSYTQYFHDDEMAVGKYFWLGSVILRLVGMMHQNYYVQPIIDDLRFRTLVWTEDTMTKKIVNVNWSDMMILEKKGFGDLKNKFLWPYSGFITSVIGVILSTIIPFSIALRAISQYSVTFIIMYIIAIPMIVYMTEAPQRNIDTWIELWSKYDRIQENITNKAIHHDKDRILKADVDLFRQMGELNRARSSQSGKQTRIASFVLTFVSVFGMFFLLDEITDSYVLLVLISQFTVLQNNISSFFSLNNQSQEMKKEYDVIDSQLFSKSDEIQYEQQTIHERIVVNSIDFERNNFSLKLNKRLVFKLGKSYRLHGKKGSGKSTFFDIVAGILGKSDIMVDGSHVSDGFRNLTKRRLYHRQKTRLAKKTSIYDLVSDTYDENIDKNIEQKVMEALNICGCDFVSLLEPEKNGHQGKKFIHDSDPGFSGGQEDIISLAATIFQLLNKDNIQIVLLDEPDSSIENDSVVDFMQTIVNICKQKNVMLICILHTEKAQTNVQYDKVIQFENGNIYL